MSEQDNVRVIQGIYDAFGRGDVATVVAACTPDVAWHAGGRQSDFPTFGPRQGRKAVEEFFKIAAETEDFQEFSPRGFYPVEDKVFVLGSYAMTIRKSGKKFASDWCQIFTFKDGKLSAYREFTDTAQAAEAFRG